MNPFEIEEITAAHLPVVLDIYNYYVQNTTATFHAKPLTSEQMHELVFFDHPVYRTFIIKEGTEICGYTLITQHKKREAYDGTAEVTIYLKPGFIGKGIGTYAIRHIEDYARKKELHVLVATICGQNENSIRLFERNGYEKCAHYREVGMKFGQWLDVVAYQKIL